MNSASPPAVWRGCTTSSACCGACCTHQRLWPRLAGCHIAVGDERGQEPVKNCHLDRSRRKALQDGPTRVTQSHLWPHRGPRSPGHWPARNTATCAATVCAFRHSKRLGPVGLERFERLGFQTAAEGVSSSSDHAEKAQLLNPWPEPVAIKR